MACLQYLGVDHVMYASDFFCSHQRGTNLGVNQGLYWIIESMGYWQNEKEVRSIQPTLVGLENLRAVKAAFQMMKINDNGIEDFFWGNAARLLGL